LNPKSQQVIQVLKDLDFSLLSNKNLSEILPSSGLGSGPNEVDSKDRKLVHLWRHSQKIWKPKPNKCLFIADSKTCRVFQRF